MHLAHQGPLPISGKAGSMVGPPSIHALTVGDGVSPFHNNCDAGPRRRGMDPVQANTTNVHTVT